MNADDPSDLRPIPEGGPTPPAATPDGAKRPMMGQAIHTVAVRTLTLGCRMLLLVILGRSLAPADYGVYALITTMTTFGVVIGGLNLYAFIYREAPGFGRARQLSLFKTTFLFEAGLSTLLVVSMLAAGRVPWLTGLLNADGYEVAFAIGLVQVVLLIAIAELSHFLLAQARIEQANWVDFLAQGSWVLFLGITWLVTGTVRLETLLICQAISAVAAITYASWLVGPRDWWNAPFDLAILRRGLAFSLPLVIPAISVYSLRLADRPILSHYVSLADVGIYSFAYTLLNTVYSFTAWVVFNTFNPRVYAAHNTGELPWRDALQTYMLKAAVASFVIPALLLFVVARPVIGLVAQVDYLPAATVLPAVALSFLMIIIAYPAHTLLTLQDRVMTLALIDVTGMAIGIAGNFLLIPRWSYWGAAAASVVGLGTAAVLKYACTDMLGRIRLDVFFSLRDERALLKNSIRRLREALA